MKQRGLTARQLLAPAARKKFETKFIIVTLEIVLVRFGVDGAGARQADLLWRRQLRFDLIRDSVGNLALKRQDIAQTAFIGLSPQMAVRRRTDQLHRDSNLVARALHGALDHGVDTQLFGN
ncbi:MAG: hypothetical protein DMG56_04650 [Acidobacteria bacterium]|nr:MAG: hypothetical protein DMG56_04650 [Acidobacteriota bacterium]